MMTFVQLIVSAVGWYLFAGMFVALYDVLFHNTDTAYAARQLIGLRPLFHDEKRLRVFGAFLTMFVIMVIFWPLMILFWRAK